jgi:hypothetical protein
MGWFWYEPHPVIQLLPMALELSGGDLEPVSVANTTNRHRQATFSRESIVAVNVCIQLACIEMSLVVAAWRAGISASQSELEVLLTDSAIPYHTVTVG